MTFVTRLKRGVRYRVTREHDIRPGTGVVSDQTIELTSARSRKAYAAPLRRVAYQDPVTKNRYVFVTNNTTWVAQTIAEYTNRGGRSAVFQVDQAASESEALRGPVEERRHDAAVGGDVHVPAVGVPEVRHADRWSLHQMLQVLLNMRHVGHSRTCSRRRRYKPPLAPNCRWPVLLVGH